MDERITNSILSAFESLSSVTYVILFGSSLKGDRKEGDIDLLVGGVLDQDTKTDLSANLGLALKKVVDIVPAVSAPASLVLHAMKTGERILVRDFEAFEAFKADHFRAFYAYDDATNLRRMKEEKLRETYSRG